MSKLDNLKALLKNKNSQRLLQLKYAIRDLVKPSMHRLENLVNSLDECDSTTEAIYKELQYLKRILND